MVQNQAQQNALAILNAITQAINRQAIQWPAPQQREVNLVKVAEYDSATDLVSWLEDFEKATTANRLMDPRKLAIVPAYLKGSANTWYQNRQLQQATQTTHWDVINGQNIPLVANTFKQPFLDHFRTPARIQT